MLTPSFVYSIVTLFVEMAKDAQDVQNSDEKLLHALHGYEKSLGLTIEKDPELTFTFTKISKVAPEAAYQVKIILDDKKDQYKGKWSRVYFYNVQ